ncbi:alpha/beta fold hydrolase [Methylorubrum thiocyanatum]|uniref:alpha/beta fold hydrolase n=1 Tax=Methylorubrum thiocyanatum TaxID=47958 RepID=UPI00383BDDE2
MGAERQPTSDCRQSLQQSPIAYLDAMGIKKAHLAGESLGGWTSAWLAINHPNRVASVQLIAAGGTKADPVIMERIKTSTTRAVQVDDEDLTRQRLNLLMHNPEKDVSEELVEVRHAIYHQPDFVANIHNLLSLQNMEIRQRNLLRPDDLGSIRAPALIVWGNQNPFGGVAEATAMHENIPGSELIVYNECGHWPQHEHAEEYNTAAIEFLRKHPIK